MSESRSSTVALTVVPSFARPGHRPRAANLLVTRWWFHDLSSCGVVSGILSEEDTSISDTDPAKSAIVLVPLAKRFDAAA
jgi:hypothetical protein